MIEDIHTHNSAAHGAVISVNPWEYSPRQGALYSVGIHPWRLKAVAGPIPDFELLEDIAGRENVVMIGETGIDKLHEPDVEYQITVLKRHIELSEQLGKPLILHCVRASNELCALHKALRPSQPWIIHGFRNNANVARRLLDAGFYLSYGEFFNIDALARPIACRDRRVTTAYKRHNITHSPVSERGCPRNHGTYLRQYTQSAKNKLILPDYLPIRPLIPIFAKNKHTETLI